MGRWVEKIMVCYRVSQEKIRKDQQFIFSFVGLLVFDFDVVQQFNFRYTDLPSCENVTQLSSYDTTEASAVDFVPPQTLEKLNMSYLNFLCLLGTKPSLYKTFQTSEFLSTNQNLGLHFKCHSFLFHIYSFHFFLYVCIIHLKIRFLLVYDILNLTEY